MNKEKGIERNAEDGRQGGKCKKFDKSHYCRYAIYDKKSITHL
jgi:hypothetical protein